VKRHIFNEQHEQLRHSIRGWLHKDVVPNLRLYDDDGIVPRELFLSAGAQGFLAFDIPEEYGGGGTMDFRNNVVLIDELQAAGTGGAGVGFTLHNDVCIPYFLRYCTTEQRKRWLPGIASGELITAIAMTEPGCGSDLGSISTSAIRDGGSYVVNGSKTFITNGINADLVITAVKTEPAKRHSGMSLLVLERGMEGFERGRNLEKLGQHAQDTAELFFHEVSVPVSNLLGEEGRGFNQLMRNLPQERLSVAAWAVAGVRAALGWTLDYVKQRTAFGHTVASFQNTRFVLAEVATELQLAESYLDRCVLAVNADQLTSEDAAMAKWWCTEFQKRSVDHCLQLFGGYGYMLDYPIARAYADARITTIYGGTTEIMKEIIARGLAL
jgi:alkylation response protein AidB-like acyl-CoA dehydrogenase